MLPPDGLLLCPVCGDPLAVRDRVVRCDAGHSFDIARQGYVNLLPGGVSTGTADTAAMVAERAAFLAAGHFEPIVTAVAQVAAGCAAGIPGCVLDAGAGTGHYLAGTLDAAPGRVGIALDISKHAVRRAAGAHPRVVAAASDIWTGLPVPDGAAAVVLNVFAPRNAAEFARVLAAGGALLTVTPEPGHLRELVDALGLVRVDADKDRRLSDTLGEMFKRVEHRQIEARLTLSHEQARALVLMGPSAWHVAPASLAAAVATLPEPVEATLSVALTVWSGR